MLKKRSSSKFEGHVIILPLRFGQVTMRFCKESMIGAGEETIIAKTTKDYLKF